MRSKLAAVFASQYNQCYDINDKNDRPLRRDVVQVVNVVGPAANQRSMVRPSVSSFWE